MPKKQPDEAAPTPPTLDPDPVEDSEEFITLRFSKEAYTYATAESLLAELNSTEAARVARHLVERFDGASQESEASRRIRAGMEAARENPAWRTS